MLQLHFATRTILVISIIFVKVKSDEYKKLKIEDVDVEFFNTTIFDEATFDISVNYKTDGANTINVVLDIMQDLTEDVYIKLKVYGQAFGAYKVPTGIAFDMNICHNTWNEFFFKVALEKIGWLDNCPPKKGRYELKDFGTDGGGLPMPALSGFRVLIDAELYSKSMVLLKSKTYLQVA